MSQDQHDDFGALLARARQGDHAALVQLSQQYEPKVRLVARVLLGPALRPHLDSLDLVQSVHKSLMLGLRQDKFDISNPEKLIALALTIVRRKVARQWRRLQRQERFRTKSSDSSNLAQLLSSLHGTELDPARTAQLNDAVEHLCTSLDATEQRMMEMHLQGYTTAEIAGEVGINPAALRVRMTRLRQRVRAEGIFSDWI
jgi:RNA polymerase sigma-70 factor (ECF subfamily)